MPIRFYCASCRQPIEVDDEHAGKVAACPYCHQVVPVPQQSTYVVPTAQPVPHGHAELRAGPEARQQAARSYGTYAIVLAALAYGLTFATVLLMPASVSQKLASMPASGPAAREELARLQEQQVREAINELRSSPWLPALGCGGLFFAVCGLILAVASLAQSRRSNWRAFIGLALSGLYLFLQCAGTVFYLALSRGTG